MPTPTEDGDERITIRYVRDGKDAHNWLFMGTKADWKKLTGLDHPDEVEADDCDRDMFDAVLDYPEGTDEEDSPYVVVCY